MVPVRLRLQYLPDEKRTGEPSASGAAGDDIAGTAPFACSNGAWIGCETNLLVGSRPAQVRRTRHVRMTSSAFQQMKYTVGFL